MQGHEQKQTGFEHVRANIFLRIRFLSGENLGLFGTSYLDQMLFIGHME